MYVCIRAVCAAQLHSATVRRNTPLPNPKYYKLVSSYGNHDPVNRTIKSGPCKKRVTPHIHTTQQVSHYSQHPRQQLPQQSPQLFKQPVNAARHSPRPKRMPAQHTLKQFRQSALLADGLTFSRFAERRSGSRSESCSKGLPEGSIVGSTV